jgi:hypothetical protein
MLIAARNSLDMACCWRALESNIELSLIGLRRFQSDEPSRIPPPRTIFRLCQCPGGSGNRSLFCEVKRLGITRRIAHKPTFLELQVANPRLARTTKSANRPKTAAFQ